MHIRDLSFDNVPMGTLGQNVLRGISCHFIMFPPEHQGRSSPRAHATLEGSCGNIPTPNVDAFCTQIHVVHNSSTLHSKCESNYSANSSGSSTIYGTRHRCCQSEGRRG